MEILTRILAPSFIGCCCVVREREGELWLLCVYGVCIMNA